jgi:hypothetical protein
MHRTKCAGNFGNRVVKPDTKRGEKREREKERGREKEREREREREKEREREQSRARQSGLTVNYYSLQDFILSCG